MEMVSVPEDATKKAKEVASISNKQEYDYTDKYTSMIKVYWDDTDMVSISGSIVNGEKEGAFTTYHKSGKVKEEENYIDGKLEGSWVGYDENGYVSIKQTFYQGFRVGKYLTYENGNLKHEINFATIDLVKSDKNKLGKQEGKEFWYNENGGISIEENWSNNKREGQYICYDENGEIKSVDVYYYGCKQQTY
tara:strand:- start:3720 stop:4295 length:576 start_codon:yes stop_codon:yes gene_type:complete